MATQPKTTIIPEQDNYRFNAHNEGSSSGVSWGAIAAGAFVTAALSLILLALGAGAGLSSLSPWSNSGVSPSTVGVGALLFLAISELISSSIGGYVAGRLRTKWVDVHSDEVYFRDTAHGFLVWAVALVISAAFLASAASAMAGAESRNNNPSRSEGPVADANRYYIDSLFRSEASPNVNEAERAEIGLIFAHALRSRGFASDDRNYVITKIVARTGLNHMDAEKRIDEVFARGQQAADAARKAVAHVLYWLFVALLLGAFCSSFAATLGGKQRDHVRTATAT